MRFAVFLLVLSLASAAGRADTGLAPVVDAPAEPAAVPSGPVVIGDPVAARLRARELRESATAERKAIDARFKADEAACYSKFLVSACLDDARKARNAALVAARRPEAEAREIERALRQREVDEREARKRPDAQRRAQEQAERDKAAQEDALRRVGPAENAAPPAGPGAN